MATTPKKEIAQAWLSDVPQDKVFWCQDGRVFKNLAELAAALRDMSEEAFRSHVNKEKNDFSNWVRDVIGDVTLATDLKKATIIATAARKLEIRVSQLKKL